MSFPFFIKAKEAPFIDQLRIKRSILRSILSLSGKSESLLQMTSPMTRICNAKLIKLRDIFPKFIQLFHLNASFIEISCRYSYTVNYIFVPRRFWVFGAAVHRQPLCLRENDVVFKCGIDVGLDVLGGSP